MDTEPDAAFAQFGQFVCAARQLDSIDALYSYAVEFAAQIFPMDRASISVFQSAEGAVELRAVHSRVKPPGNFAVGAKLAVTGSVSDYMKRVSVPRIWFPDDPDASGASVVPLRGLGMRSVINAPLITAEGIIGTFNVGSRDCRYRNIELHLLQHLAALVGTFVDRIRRIDSVTASSTRHRLYAAHLEQLNVVAESLTLSTTIDQAMEHVAICAESLVGARRVSYCELEPGGQEIQILGLVGQTSDRRGQVISLEKSGLSDVIVHGKAQYVADLLNSRSESRRNLGRAGLNHLWSFPVVCAGVTEGVMNIASPAIELHPDDAYSAISALSRLLGSTIERIKARQETENALKLLALQSTTDSLTGLCNRVEFRNRLERCLKRPQNVACMGVMFLDLDLFKNINDTLGHSVGDAVLSVVATRLEKVVQSTDTVARVGGDEFLILLPDAGHREHLKQLAMTIVDTVKQPVLVEGYDLEIGVSIGVCSYPHDGASVDELIMNADIAMYRAKELGRNQFHLFNPELASELNRKVLLGAALKSGLRNNEFYLLFQPQVDIKSGKTLSVEALLRWQHPQEGNIPPDVFIPIAESNGLVNELTSWVLDNSLMMLAALRLHHPDLRIAVNVSAREFASYSRLFERVVTALQKSGLPASALELELTETAFLTHPEKAPELVRQFSEAGVKLSIDDFGTGYASLSYLVEMPISMIKIDRSFVNGLESDRRKQAVVSGIFAIAKNMQLACVGEGVETIEQLQWLQSHGCQYAQGYFISRPVSAEGLCAFLSTDSQLLNAA